MCNSKPLIRYKHDFKKKRCFTIRNNCNNAWEDVANPPVNNCGVRLGVPFGNDRHGR